VHDGVTVEGACRLAGSGEGARGNRHPPDWPGQRRISHIEHKLSISCGDGVTMRPARRRLTRRLTG